MKKQDLRYLRQTALKEIGEEGQNNISNARVLVVGAGGLGSPALTYLALAGVGTIGVIDHDIVGFSNLHRQTLFTEKNIGDNKAECASRSLKKLNPLVKIITYPEKLTADNVLDVFKDYEIIIDGSDNFNTKYLINDACVKLGIPLVFAAASSFNAQLTTFWHPYGPCYRCLYPHQPDGHIPNCAELGVLGAFTGIIGSFQALEAIKIASKANLFKHMTGKLWTMDAITMEFYSHTLKKNETCPVCSKPSSDIVIEPLNYISNSISEHEISVSEAQKIDNAIFIDVREQNEWDTGHINGAIHIPLNNLNTTEPLKLDKSKLYITYCKTGPRSQKGFRLLSSLGFNNLRYLKGGYESWTENYYDSDRISN